MDRKRFGRLALRSACHLRNLSASRLSNAHQRSIMTSSPLFLFLLFNNLDRITDGIGRATVSRPGISNEKQYSALCYQMTHSPLHYCSKLKKG